MKGIIQKGASVTLKDLDKENVFIVTDILDENTVEVECVEVKYKLNGKYRFRKKDLDIVG